MFVIWFCHIRVVPSLRVTHVSQEGPSAHILWNHRLLDPRGKLLKWFGVVHLAQRPKLVLFGPSKHVAILRPGSIALAGQASVL